MDIPLPPRFAERINMLDAALIDYQCAHQDEKKDEARVRIFVLSCEILNSIDVDDLDRKLSNISPQAGYAELLKLHNDYFDEFIDLENSIFEKIGVDASARARIAEYMAVAREKMGPSAAPSVPGLGVAGALRELQSEVCRVARVTLAKVHVYDEQAKMAVEQTTWRRKIVNIGTSVLGVAVTTVNVAAGFAGFMSVDNATYSATIGATMLVFRQ